MVNLKNIVIIGIYFFSINIMALQGMEELKSALSGSSQKQVYLIIGVRCGEEQFEERFSHLLNNPDIFPVFADLYPPIKDMPGHCLTGNFNDVKEISILAQNFPDTFDVISSDGIGTTKFLMNYNDDIINLLAKSLKADGRLFYHDQIDMLFYDNIPAIADTLVISEQDKDQYMEKVISSLGSGFRRLPSGFLLPRSLLQNIPIDKSEVQELTDEVINLIEKFEPSKFLATINELQRLGLQKANLTQGRAFRVRERGEIEPLIERALKERVFMETVFPDFVKQLIPIIKESIGKNLKNQFSSIEVVPLDNDHESLAIVNPKEKNSVKYIIYKLKK